MIEVFKAILNVDQIKAKCEQLDARHFEIQLLEDDINNAGELINKLSLCIPYMEDVVSVHTALTMNYEMLPGGNCDLHNLENKNTYRALEDAAVVAQVCSHNYNHAVAVVIHNSLSYSEFMICTSLRDELIYLLRQVLTKYPNVDLWIENVTPICNEERVYFRDGVLDDAVLIANYLSKIFGNRVHTVFDTCHAVVTDRIVKGNLGKSVIDDLIDKYADSCREVHFSNVINLGYNKGEHGCGFTDKDHELLDYLMNKISCNMRRAYLCYEICEDDYMKNTNVAETKRLVHEWLSEHDDSGVKIV